MRYRLLMSLLYGQYPWLTRHPGGLMSVPTGPLCRALGTRAADLRAALDWGRDVGLWDSVTWHGHWFMVRPIPPVGMAREVVQCQTLT